METVTLPRDIAQETRIALLDRAIALRRDTQSDQPIIREIAMRQLARVSKALAVFNNVLQEG